MYTQNRVIGQKEIIQKMKELGYKDADEDGVCFGITHMMIQAILIGQRTEFEDRIRLIVETHDLKGEIEKAQERIKERDNLKKKQKRIEQIIEKINKNKEEFEEFSEEDLKRLVKLQEDLKLRLKPLEDKLPEDLKLLEVLSFFDGIMLYQYAIKSSEWFSENIIQTQPSKVSQFVQPPALEDEGGMVAVYSGPGIYTELELSSYLLQLSKILEKLPDHDKIAVEISCSNHSMLLTYNSKNKRWNFFDPNQLLKGSVVENEIAIEVMKGFGEYPITAFNTKIYTTESYEKIHNLKEDLKESLKEKFGKLHQISVPEINEVLAKKKTNQNITLLWIAVQHGDLKIVKALLENGAEINLVSSEGYTVLYIAAQQGHFDVVQALLEKGAKVDAADIEGTTALHLAAQDGHLEVVKFLLTNGAKIDLPDNDGWTALHIAAQNGHLKVVKFLLENGASVNRVNNDGDGVLHIAAENGHLGVVQILLENGALVNSEDSNKWTALHIAAHNGYLEIVKFLLEKGALANLIDKDENTALYQAAKNGHFKVVEALVEKGAMINMTNSHGWTALHFAVLKNELEIVKYLIKKGARIDLIDTYEKTVLELAEAQDHPDIVNVIKNAIASSTKKSESLPLFKLSSSLQKKNNENEENKENTSPKSPNSTY